MELKPFIRQENEWSVPTLRLPYAGIWAKHSRIALDPGDVEEGLGAARAIGDDRLQHQSQGYVVPESWTHGSSEMRMRWLRRGMETGDPNSCDTFAAESL